MLGWARGIGIVGALAIGTLTQACSGTSDTGGWGSGGGSGGAGASSSSGGGGGSSGSSSGASSGASGSSSGGGSSGGGSSGGSGGSGSGGGSGGGSSSGASGSGGTTGNGTPPFGGSSKGSGGGPASGDMKQAGSINYNLIIPSSPASPMPLCIVYSGVEGGQAQTMDLLGIGPMVGADGIAFAVLDGTAYNGDGNAGATVLDDLRSKYDVDNDRTYLLGESAGTTAAEQLGFHLRQSYFAAYWANDVIAPDAPAQTAAQLGFHPWGQAGPGGDVPDATSIVMAEQSAGYRLPNPAPYNGPGSDSHGDQQQYTAAISFFPGKARQ